MADSTPRLGTDLRAVVAKMGAVRLSDDNNKQTEDYVEILTGTGVPSGAYGRAAGVTMVYYRQDASTVAEATYVTVDGGTTWTAQGLSPTLSDFADSTTLAGAREALELWVTDGTGYYAYQTPAVNDDLCLLPTGTGGVGIRITDPTAWLHIDAGTAAPGTAPLKLTQGVLNTAPESGAIEYDGAYFWLTVGAARRRAVMQSASTSVGALAIWSANGVIGPGAVGLAGTKVYYVADNSGGSPTRKLTFTDGILTSET